MPGQPINNILFLDIETVSQYPAYSELPRDWRELWDRKAEYLIRDRVNDSPESIYGRAAIYAEFGKVICIGCGIISGGSEDRKLSIKSFYGHDEREILVEFCGMLHRWDTDHHKLLCAHNGKEFDFPFLCRRLVIQGIPVPPILNTQGKKPWEVQHLDTLELWKFGDYKTFTSLGLLALALGIPTPKDDIDGRQVGDVYWNQHDLMRIVNYCQKDVVTLAQIYLRLNEESLIRDQNIGVK
jgi:DNA polymerase elongation subunit (family B)